MRPQFCNFTSGKTGVAIGAHNFLQNHGKRNLFSQNWSGNDGKNYRLQDFYDILYLHVKMTKTGTAVVPKSETRGFDSWLTSYSLKIRT